MPSGGVPSPNGRKRPPIRLAQPPGSERRPLPIEPNAGRECQSALREVRQRFAAVVMRPLTPDWTAQPLWIDGRSSQEVVAEFIKPTLRDGASIAEAVGNALESTTDEATDWPAMIQKWFALWMSFGWFCVRVAGWR